MALRKVKKLIELLEESGIAEIEIKEGEESVRISRMPPAGVTQVQAYAPAPMHAATASPEGAATAAPAKKPRANEHVISAPMVGTYYASSAPGAKPFIEIGDEVNVGQVLCIIEAMKMMNQIESDKAGRITSIMVQNGEPVEFSQPLFTIE